MNHKDHKLAAIVFTDIVGYTKQMEENEQRTMQLLQKQREIVFPIVESYGGEIIKEIGDGLLMMFGSAVEAVRCASSIQTRLKDEELTIRAGIHIGDVIFKDGDVFGSAVNTAARIEPLAPPNGICISEDVRSQLRNKEDITLLSIGRKELKGVGKPIEIFEVFIEGVSIDHKRDLGFILRDLWNRRVFQILIGYLIGSWIIKQAVAAIVTNYMLSPYLVDLAWVILLSLIPTVFLLTYFHGKRSFGKWSRAEVIGLPVNAVITIALVVILFQGKDLGAATETVVVEDESGATIERVVSKNEFRKKLALYFFNNKTGDSNLDWMSYAIPAILDYDLSQNLFLHAQPAAALFYKFKEAGYSSGLGAPLMLLKNISEYYQLEYFVTGDFNKQTEGYWIKVKLFETANARMISEFEFSNKNFFTLIDNVSAMLTEKLELPSRHKTESSDLPIAEIYTDSIKALEYITKGNNEILINNNWHKATEYVEMAIEEDPGFTLAHLVLAEYCFNSNNISKAEEQLQITMDNIYNLPERLQFNAKFFYYISKQEPDKALAVLKMWTELFPEDIEAHEMLATRYQYKSMLKESIEEYRAILRLDPGQTKYVRYIGDLHEARGNYDSAMHYHTQYAESNPMDYKAYRNLGELYLNLGDYENAAKMLEKASIMGSQDIDVELTRIKVDMRLGKFKEVEEQFSALLKNCPTVQDSSSVFDNMSDFYEMLGQMQKSLYYQQQFVAGIKNFINPLNYLVYRVFSVEKYINAGKRDALQILEKANWSSSRLLTKLFLLVIYITIWHSTALVKLNNTWEKLKSLPLALVKRCCLTIFCLPEQ
ncbi:MAG: adenylate/guanylate cyclase domain-containing protein [Bacteroidales bacterium]